MGFFELLVQSFPRFAQSLWLAVQVTLVGLIIAMPLGLMTCLMTMSHRKLLHGLAAAYVWIIRGTPMIVQAFFFYLGVPQVTGLKLSAITAGVIVITLNAGAYLSEIFRSGIQSIPVGQMEAARSLGMPHRNAMVKVILPQAFRVVVPSMVNQFIISFKDTSILSVIGLNEITKTGKSLIALNYQSFKMWIIVALYYLLIVSVLTWGAKKLEGRLTYVRKS